MIKPASTRPAHRGVRRSFALTLAILSIAAMALPALANAAEQRFWVSAYGTQTTTWSYPYFVDGGSCYGIPWSQSEGSEVIHFRTPRIKVLAMEFGPAVILHYGNWSFDEVSKMALVGNGYVDREATETDGVNPGSCGGESSTSSPKFDCGRKPMRFDVVPSWPKPDQMQLLVLSHSDLLRGIYNNCPVYYPQVDRATGQDVTIPPGQFDTIDATFPKSELFDRRIGKEIILGKANYDDWNDPGERPFKASTVIRWTVTFTKAR